MPDPIVYVPFFRRWTDATSETIQSALWMAGVDEGGPAAPQSCQGWAEIALNLWWFVRKAQGLWPLGIVSALSEVPWGDVALFRFVK